MYDGMTREVTRSLSDRQGRESSLSTAAYYNRQVTCRSILITTTTVHQQQQHVG